VSLCLFRFVASPGKHVKPAFKSKSHRTGIVAIFNPLSASARLDESLSRRIGVRERCSNVHKTKKHISSSIPDRNKKLLISQVF
jgi:hypothetical protein